MRLVVLDASAALDYLLNNRRGRRCAPWIEPDDVDLYTAEVCDVEVVSGLRRLLLAGQLHAGRAEEALETHLDLRLTRLPHGGLAAEALGLRENFAAADGFYVALARALDAALLTTDARLARAVRRHTAVEVVPA